MPARLKLRSLAQLAELQVKRSSYICGRCQYATAAAAVSAKTQTLSVQSGHQFARYSLEQPASHRDPKYRKSQLIRSYVSLLQTTPLIILFQHNNIKTVEWTGMRRELANALKRLDDANMAQGANAEDIIGEHVKLQIIKTSMFEPALRITEFYKTGLVAAAGENVDGDAGMKSEKEDPSLHHALSEAAYNESQKHKNEHALTPLLSGSIAILTFPSVSPQYVKAALSILAPQAPNYPAPTRRAFPSYHDPPVQDGLKKLLLLGARVDGQIFDYEGTRWVGSIDGGITGLRAQLVAILQGFGAGLTTTLESASRSLWFTMEGRRTMLEEESKPKAAEEEKKE